MEQNNNCGIESHWENNGEFSLFVVLECSSGFFFLFVMGCVVQFPFLIKTWILILDAAKLSSFPDYPSLELDIHRAAEATVKAIKVNELGK